MAKRLIGSGTTGTDGSVSIPYNGTGAGVVNLSVETEIDGSIVSGTLPVLDTLMYDTGTDATHNIWAGDTSNLSRGNEYSTLREAEEGTTTRIVTQLPKGLWFLNMQVRRDGSTGNFNFEVIHNNATIFGWATPNGDTWADLKLVYDGEYISCFINDSSTPARKERVYIDETKNTYFRLQTPQSITYVDFKDLLVFREGASSISIGSSTPVIQSGDTATITGSLYESGLPVQNATLDVYKDGSKVGTVSTGDSGVASYTYTGVADGEVEFQFRYGSILSETFVVTDCIKYDGGTSNTSHLSIWNTTGATPQVTPDYTSLIYDNAVIWHTCEFNAGSDFILEFDVNITTTNRGAYDITIRNANQDLLNYYVYSDASLQSDNWYHITCRVENNMCTISNDVTPYVRSRDITGYSKFVFNCRQDETVRYKNFKIYPI